MQSSISPKAGCFTSIIICGVITAVITGLSIVGRGCSYLNRTADVVEQQLDPAALLAKYEWFKDLAAACDAQLADIDLYKSRITQLEQSYGETPRKDWDRADKDTINQWSQELAGISANYNKMAAEYNAAMAKINYKFTNVGDLPFGAVEPLPREMRTYKQSL